MPTVAVTRRLPGSALTRLATEHDVVVWPGRMPPAPMELWALAAGADGLLCLLTDRIDADLLAAAPHLRAIANYAVGYDNIDVAAVRARQIPVGVTPDVLTDATADLTLALLLSCARGVPSAAAAVRSGTWRTWEPRGWLGLELRGATLVLVGGGGRIGRAVAQRAAAFGMTVESVGRHDDLHAALARADVVSLHCPLGPETARMIDADALATMRPGSILINTARGGLVDQVALRGRPRARPSGRRGAGRHRPRAPTARRPAAVRAEPHRRPAHRVGDAAGPRADGGPRGGQPARGVAGR